MLTPERIAEGRQLIAEGCTHADAYYYFVEQDGSALLDAAEKLLYLEKGLGQRYVAAVIESVESDEDRQIL